MRIINAVLTALVLTYAVFVFLVYPTPIFNPYFAGQDARQQLFPYYSVIYPDIFKDDYIYRAMKLYIGPLHWVLGSAITKLTLNPIMTGHWIMTIQLGLAALFIFLTVRRLSSVTAALFSIAWLLQTPRLISNTFGGLPRGWAPVIIASFLYFLSRRNHIAVFFIILCGCLLHPHSTLLIGLTYGMFLIFDFFRAGTRKEIILPLVIYVCLAPLYVTVTYLSVDRPPEIGKMVTLKEALNIPAVSRKGGRFPLAPLNDPLYDFTSGGLRVFYQNEDKHSDVTEKAALAGIFIVFGGALLVQFVSKRSIWPRELILYPLAIVLAYFLARIFAFHLYIPTRYLGWPLSIFFLIAMPLVVWRIFAGESRNGPRAILATLILMACAVPLFLEKGLNFKDSTNFKPSSEFQDPLFTWIRERTPKHALIAGHPSHMSGLQLYGIRKGFVTTETAHPFYDKYRAEMEKRLETAFRALYAKDGEEFLQVINGSGIDYFVFGKKYFEIAKKKGGATFKRATYFKPHTNLVRQLASRPLEEYLFKNLEKLGGSARAPYIVYHSKRALVIDVAKFTRERKRGHSPNAAADLH